MTAPRRSGSTTDLLPARRTAVAVIAPEVAHALAKLALAEEIERLAQRLYLSLAARFAAEPDAAALFAGLAAEEEQHALRVSLMRESYGQNPARYGPLKLDTTAMTRAKAEGAALLVMLETPETHLGLDQAMRLAAALEEKFANAHADQLAAQSDPTLREFFEVFVAQDRAHAALLARGR
jgi:rubrerythrin